MQPIDRAISNLKSPSNPQVFVAPRYEIVGFKDGQPLLKPPGGEPFQGGKLVSNGSIQSGPIFTQQAGGAIQGWTMPRVVTPTIVQSPIDSLQIYFLVDRFDVGFTLGPDVGRKHDVRSAIYELFKLIRLEGRSELTKSGIRNLEIGFGTYCGSFTNEISPTTDLAAVESAMHSFSSPPFRLESPPQNRYWLATDYSVSPSYISDLERYVPNLPLTLSTELFPEAQGFYKPNDSIAQALNQIKWGQGANVLIVLSAGSEELGDRQSQTGLSQLKAIADNKGVQIVFVSNFDYQRSWFVDMINNSFRPFFSAKPPFNYRTAKLHDDFLGWNQLECLFFGTSWIRLEVKYSWRNIRYFRNGSSVSGWWSTDRILTDGWLLRSTDQDESPAAFTERRTRAETIFKSRVYQLVMKEIKRSIDRANTRQTWTYNQYLDAFAEAWVATNFTTAPPPR